MKKIIALLLILACVFSFCACDTGAIVNTEEITITKENWSDYITVAVLTEPQKNASGEIENMYCQTALVFKDEYKDKVVSADIRFDLTVISSEWFFADYNVNTDTTSLVPFTESDRTQYGYSKQYGSMSHSGIFSKVKNYSHIYIGHFFGNSGQYEINVSEDNSLISSHIVLCSDYSLDNIGGTVKIKA